MNVSVYDANGNLTAKPSVIFVIKNYNFRAANDLYNLVLDDGHIVTLQEKDLDAKYPKWRDELVTDGEPVTIGYGVWNKYTDEVSRGTWLKDFASFLIVEQMTDRKVMRVHWQWKSLLRLIAAKTNTG